MRTLFLYALLVVGLTGKAQFRPENSELFIEIKDAGKYEVMVNDDYAYSRLGRTRFYDVIPGPAKLSISFSGRTVYSKELRLQPGQRTLVTYSKREGLRVSADLQIYRNGQYALDNWSGSLYGTDDRPGNGRPSVRLLRADEYSSLLVSLKKEPFDDAREKIVRMALQNSMLSVSQLRSVLECFTFDDKRLAVALDSYRATYDRNSYYQLRDLFNLFNKDRFDAFLLKQGREG